MKIINFENIKEKIYYEKLDNGMEVYLYPTNKSKNFYASISTKYGSSTTSYKKGEENISVYPGTAHFLEHKVMNFTTNKEYFERMNELGSACNAYTTYNVTNYNIFGSGNVNENLNLLFDMVMNPGINEENVESEKGIICEEIDMDKDDVITNLYIKRNQNLFHKLYPINHILGEKEDINKINSSYLKMIYKDFYKPSNMFIIVVGSFILEDVLEFIKAYMKKVINKTEEKIKIKKIKEPDKVKVEYEIVKKEVSEDKVYYSSKINKKIFKGLSDYELSYYLRIILSSNFAATSPLYEKYKMSNLITTLKSEFKIFDNHLILTIKASTPNSEKFISNLKKDIKNLNIDENTFIRKKRKILSETILTFENIEDVEFLITNSILTHKKLYNKDYDLIKNLDYKIINDIIKKINFDNSSLLICTR